LPLRHHWKPKNKNKNKTLLAISNFCNKWHFINCWHLDITNFLYLDSVSKKSCKVKGFQEGNVQLVKTYIWVSKTTSPLMIP
jgi:hypothetical protein